MKNLLPASLASLIVALAILLYSITEVPAQSSTGGRSVAASQVSVGATATITAIARTNRLAVTIQNHGATAMYCGPSSAVLTTTGFRLPGVDGASVTIPSTAIIYCITGGGSQTVSVLESF